MYGENSIPVVRREGGVPVLGATVTASLIGKELVTEGLMSGMQTREQGEH